jgi:3-methyladenine DNA glycosylase AlkD
MKELTAKKFTDQLKAFQSTAELKNVQRFFRDEGSANKFLGIRMANIFALAKEFTEMPLTEIAKLLQNEYYEIRMGAVSIMDFKARQKTTTPACKKQLFELYIKRHDRINNWDLVDRSAPYVVGGYLFDKPRTILYKLAKSKNVWERRTAIVSTYFFIRQKDVSDTFNIAAILVQDEHDFIQKAVGSWIREAGKKDKLPLIEFLDQFAGSMPRTMLRYAIEKLDKKEKDYYLAVNSKSNINKP